MGQLLEVAAVVVRAWAVGVGLTQTPSQAAGAPLLPAVAVVAAVVRRARAPAGCLKGPFTPVEAWRLGG